MLTLKHLIRDGATAEQTAWFLDRLSHEERLRHIEALGRHEMDLLYHGVEGVFPLTLSDFVPNGTDPLREVIHDGFNTLPAFRAFQKRFVRPTEADWEVLFGYNHQWYGWWTGPGYFVARPGWPSDPVVVDYIEPARQRDPRWPELAPSHARLGRFIYRNTVDRMRRVSEHVTIGAAFKADRDAMGVYFMLARRP